MSAGKILKIKQGYNPNSSSIGSETTGAVSETLQVATNTAKFSIIDLLRYLIGILIAAIVIFWVSKIIFYKIKKRAKNKKKKKHGKKIKK